MSNELVVIGPESAAVIAEKLAEQREPEPVRKPKICVYAICKNESAFVERFLDAARDADLIMIADTGSADDTYKEIFRAAARLEIINVAGYKISIKPWRFDHARNAVLAMIPSDMDICVSLDLDEILQPGWREEIERVWEVGETTRLRYMFDWGLGIAFMYEKIHARDGYYWHHPCHEYPMPDGRITEVWAETQKLLVIHKPDPTKSRGQYLDLLKLSVEEDPLCPRNAFYYARELSFVKNWPESIKECDRYLALPRATWPNERCYAYRVKGRCFVEMGDLSNAERQFHLAAMEAPNTREPWFELSELMYKQARWPECFAFAMRTLAITDREKVYTVDPKVWGFSPHDYAAISAYHLGVFKVAVEQGVLACAAAPHDERLCNNLKFYQEKV